MQSVLPTSFVVRSDDQIRACFWDAASAVQHMKQRIQSNLPAGYSHAGVFLSNNPPTPIRDGNGKCRGLRYQYLKPDKELFCISCHKVPSVATKLLFEAQFGSSNALFHELLSPTLSTAANQTPSATSVPTPPARPWQILTDSGSAPGANGAQQQQRCTLFSDQATSHGAASHPRSPQQASTQGVKRPADAMDPHSRGPSAFVFCSAPSNPAPKPGQDTLPAVRISPKGWLIKKPTGARRPKPS